MEDTLQDSQEYKNQKRISMAITILLILAVVLCLYATIQVLSYGYVNIGGFMLFWVITGSMEPTIPVGSLLLTRHVDIESIQLEDIICFRTEASEIWGKIVTHRVVDVFRSEFGGVLLATKGDANLAVDGYLVDQTNYVGKVIWHTGDGSVLANILSLLTSKIGFLACIVLPTLLLASLILRDSVINIRKELRQFLEEEQSAKEAWENDPLCGMTQEEYNEMYERIRAELMEELKHFAEVQMEPQKCSEISEKE